MRVKYSVVLEVHAYYECEDVGELKDNYEYAQDIGQLICDEISTAGGVGCYNVKRSLIETITEN